MHFSMCRVAGTMHSVLIKMSSFCVHVYPNGGGVIIQNWEWPGDEATRRTRIYLEGGEHRDFPPLRLISPP